MSTSRKIMIAVVGALAVAVATLSTISGVSMANELEARHAAASEAQAEDSWSDEEAASTDESTYDESTEGDDGAYDSDEGSSEDFAAPTQAEDAATVEVVDWADGESAKASSTETVWGEYPAATATVWAETVGAQSGETLSPGTVTVAAQRDLGVDNPTYTEGETNTWWLWTQSDDGTWDWFPATAFAEGASNQPINGIALAE